jgi:hypothetical protein
MIVTTVSQMTIGTIAVIVGRNTKAATVTSIVNIALTHQIIAAPS